MHFEKFHPEVASCLLSRGKRKYATLGMRLIWKYIRNYFLVNQSISHFCHISRTTKNLKLKFWICNQKNMRFHLISKNVLLPVEPWGDENVIGIRTFNIKHDVHINGLLRSLLATTFWEMLLNIKVKNVILKLCCLVD